MIYVIDNDKDYSDNTIYFVEAAADFEKWFDEMFVPWCQRTSTYGVPKIIFKAKALEWRNPKAVETAADFWAHYDDWSEEDVIEGPPGTTRSDPRGVSAVNVISTDDVKPIPLAPRVEVQVQVAGCPNGGWIVTSAADVASLEWLAEDAKQSLIDELARAAPPLTIRLMPIGNAESS